MKYLLDGEDVPQDEGELQELLDLLKRWRNNRCRKAQPIDSISTPEELDALPVGAVVMTLWAAGPMNHVFQRYSDGWYGFPSHTAMFPLGTAKNGETVLVLWPRQSAAEENNQ